LVAFVGRRVSDADGARPPAHPPHDALALRARELLGVAHTAQVLGRWHHGRDRDRTRPRAPTHLVHPADHAVAGSPELPFPEERRASPTDRHAGEVSPTGPLPGGGSGPEPGPRSG